MLPTPPDQYSACQAPAAPLAAQPAPAIWPVVQVQALGLVPYVPTWELQEQLLAATLAIKAANRTAAAAGQPQQPTPQHLLLCEHPPTYTLGKSGKPEHLLLDEATLAEHGATFHRINRGGDITFHGPGQLVAYPILDLEALRPDIHWYLRALEEAVIQTLAGYGLRAGRIAGLTGVWLDWEENAPSPRKICALGVRCSRWVTLHGLALNVNTDLRYFSYIVPCGIADKAVTSLQAELGRAVSLAEVQARLLPELLWQLGAAPTASSRSPAPAAAAPLPV
ncbi:MAG: lipoyl(octanoyl) transferase LipB [Janthinobacterium lividum]